MGQLVMVVGRVLGFVVVLLTAATVAAQSLPVEGREAYEESIERGRAERRAALAAEDGWLAVTGLFWLREGFNVFGRARDNDIVLSPGWESGAVPVRIGSLELREGKVTLRVVEGVEATVNGKPVGEMEVQSDAAGKADLIKVGDLSFMVLRRGVRFGLRVRDANSRARRDFTGLRWYPVNPSYRLTAKFIAYDQPREIPIVNILGDVEKYKSPGLLKFVLAGKEYSLEPVVSGGGRLFIIFRDQTSNRTTYAAGRFLYAELPKDGQVVLDFNQAINPPCAFTAYATCPLPPKQNRLGVAIEAGELTYRGLEAGSSSTHSK